MRYEIHDGIINTHYIGSLSFGEEYLK